MATIEWAQFYVERGWAPIPVPFQSKAPNQKRWQQLRLTAQNLAQHFNGRPQNIGVLLGAASGNLVDVDVDAAEALAMAAAFLPPTCIFGRPSKPRSHWLYALDRDMRTEKFPDPQAADDETAMLVELRADGAQTVFPGSTHPSGEPIDFERDAAGAIGEPARLAPAALRRAVAHLAVAALLARYWPSAGRRQEAALAVSGFLLRARVSEDDVARVLRAVACLVDDSADVDKRVDAARATAEKLAQGDAVTGGTRLGELLRGEGTKVVRQIGRWLGAAPEAETASPAPSPRGASVVTAADDLLAGDIANAAALVAAHGQDFRYGKFCGWLRWDGRRWAPDVTDEIVQRAKTVARALLARVPDFVAIDRATVARIVAAQSATKLHAMVQLAESEPPIPVALAAALDVDPWLFNVLDGTLDLRTGAIREPCREDLITKLAPVRYDPAAECPRFLRFLDEIFAGDAAMVGFLQRFVGHALTGDVREDVFSIWYGLGSNGKTTLKETLLALFGEYALTTPATTFLEKKGDSIPNDIARLKGARLVMAVEPEQGAKLATAMVKAMTGRDHLSARFMRREWFDFAPSFKPVLVANTKPFIKEVTHALWRRMRLVPFDVTFGGPAKDQQLGGALLRELPGILNWALAGCLVWQREGLGEAARITAATAEYRVESDWFAGFLGGCCESGDPNFEEDAGTLYQRYAVWAAVGGGRMVSKQAFGRMLTERGFGKRESDSKTLRLGLRLKKPEGSA